MTGNPLGYRQRTDRCEGIYWEPHAARDSISVISYTNGPLPAGPSIPETLPIGWSAGTGADAAALVRLRAASLSAKLYYRMDATRPSVAGSYPWPTDVLRELKQLTLRDLGFIALTTERVGEVNWATYLPVSVGASPRAPALALTLAATTPIRNLDWECLRIDRSGVPGKRVASGRLPGPLEMLEPVRLTLPIAGFSGLCYLELRAEPLGSGAGPLATSIVIRVPRAARP